jgi:transcriptional regulator with XRE-family HTH domain
MENIKEAKRIRGQRLRMLRQRKGLTQVQVGQRIGAKSPSTTISQLEAGKMGMTLEHIERLSAVLEVPPAVIATARELTEEEIDFIIKVDAVVRDKDTHYMKVLSDILATRTKG